MRRAWVATAAILAAAILAGCGADQATETAAPPHDAAPPHHVLRDVNVSLDKTLNAANVAIELGVKRGYFADVGLNVFASSPLLPDRPVQYVTGSTDDFALSQQPQVVLAGGNGAHVVAVGSLISQPTAAVIAGSDRAAKEPAMVRNFMSALARAVAAMKADPQAAIELVEASNRSISHPGLAAQIKATIPLISSTGRIDPSQAKSLTAWMHEEGMIARKPAFSDYFTNQYLSGEADRRGRG